ncbi:MAG: aspartate:alanine exchanger family transporter [Chloroherpetonaceae bacterium]|nr:aspartate:alanine exchanger family transporter [Chloroherpetonaceae bacterium]
MFDFLLSFLSHNPIILLFLTIGIGFFLSEIKIKGIGLGVVAVLFVGIGLGAWGKEAFRMPEIISQIGLLLFVYTIGLHAGPAFFRILKNNGVLLSVLALVAVLSASVAVWLTVKYGNINPVTAVGLFCGALTNTPALAAAGESLGKSPEAAFLTVGYSVAYPLAVAIPILIAQFYAQSRKLNIAEETKRAEISSGENNEPPVAKNVVIENAALEGLTISEAIPPDLMIKVSRYERRKTSHDEETDVQIPTLQTTLKRGDILHLVGSAASLLTIIPTLGTEISSAGPETRRDQIDYRRILITNSELVGRTIEETKFEEKYGAVITRLRRGDTEFVPSPKTVLERGDRVRVVAPASKMPEISKYLGDSFRAISETDFFSFAVGILLGALLGNIVIPIGEHFSIKLGLAGGPLIVALILGYIGRTGPIFWTLPLNINFTFRQLGLVLFFSAVGLKAGGSFAEAFADQGLRLIGFGALITTISACILFFGSLWIMKSDWVTSTGALAGGQTQPAILSFVGNMAKSEAPNVAYVSILPAAMIFKILVAQILLWFLTL